MDARILKGIQAEYERAEYPGRNESGIKPIGTSVLVLMDQTAEQTSGGVLLPPERLMEMNLASETGVVTDVGSAAFRYYDDGSKWTDYKPAAGDRVFTERYAGRVLQGSDGRVYRMMTYTCIAGIEIPPKPKRKEKG